MKINKLLLMCTLGSVLVSMAKAEDNGPWPTATEDSVTLTSNQRVYLPVLDNDIGQALELIDVNETTVALGRVEIDESKKAVYYRSAEDYVGEDSFWYAFTDHFGRTNAAKVSMKVIEPVVVPPEEPEEPEGGFQGWPTANADVVSTSKNTPIDIAVLENDIGFELAIIEVNTSTVKLGRAAIQGDKISYTPPQDFVGEDSFWYAFTDSRGRTNSSKVTVTVTDDEITPPVVSVDFSLVTMHDDVLRRQSHIYGESGDTVSFWVTRDAQKGDTEIRVRRDHGLKEGQLITYRSEAGDYYTATVASVSGQRIKLNTPLEAPIGRGAHVWNFYHDGAHPNVFGFRAIADFALRQQGVDALNTGKHVLLGDSWFSSEGVSQRLAEKLSDAQIINEGVGGSTAANLLSRFDQAVTAQNPDVVWLIAGTNDYYQGVSLVEYTKNMRALITKINALGAKAIVIDASVAPLISGSASLTDLSHEYAAAVANLLAE